MRHIFTVLAALSLCACVVAGRPASRSEGVTVVERRCPPAHHFEAGVGCVHNGNARGHYK